ncbi:MAG: hypothetical protein AAB263_02625 [Planctomycetota bacterium]
MKTTICIEWMTGKPAGSIELKNGVVRGVKIVKGHGKTAKNKFAFTGKAPFRLAVSLDGFDFTLQADKPLVKVNTTADPFSFFLRDVSKDFPIIILDGRVCVLSGNDKRSYLEIEESISGLHKKTYLERIKEEPEEDFDSAATKVRKMVCPTWLGTGRHDIRNFEVGFVNEDYHSAWNWIQPKNHHRNVIPPDTGGNAIVYCFSLGRGIGVTHHLKKRLEDGVLPIVNAEYKDESIDYRVKIFVSAESGNVNTRNITGTHYLVADKHSGGVVVTDKEKYACEEILRNQPQPNEESVLFLKIEAVNTADVPRYAWFQSIIPEAVGVFAKINWQLERETGFSSYSAENIFCVSSLNGEPLCERENAVLLKPGEHVAFVAKVPHVPISRARARKLANVDFEKAFRNCNAFWAKKIKPSEKITVPEKRINEMIRAGLAHLDIVTYGKDPAGALAACVGVYSPIGTESSQIIQFYDSLGLHDTAERCLEYFLEKQHENGEMMNYDRYTIETGAVLWNIGVHYAYTHDLAWANKIKGKVLLACKFISDWRARNMSKELLGKGYGMIAGKCADPEDPFHSFMLNGYAYLGLKHSGKMLLDIDRNAAKKILKEADELKNCMVSTLNEAVANSPVVPLGDGTWCRTCPTWPEMDGPCALYVDKKNVLYSHGAYIRDILGPLYAVFCEVLEPKGKLANALLNSSAELLYQNNSAFSQPYYSPHPWIHLQRGETKEYLKAYYNTLAALADRDTYSFWEHLFRVSPHKTHEEGWFLMYCRWMLYMEHGNELNLLYGTPEKWFADGNVIEVKKVKCYFGELAFRVESSLNQGHLHMEIHCNSQRKPKAVNVKIPTSIKITRVQGGRYDKITGIIRIENFTGQAKLVLYH